MSAGIAAPECRVSRLEKGPRPGAARARPARGGREAQPRPGRPCPGPGPFCAAAWGPAAARGGENGPGPCGARRGSVTTLPAREKGRGCPGLRRGPAAAPAPGPGRGASPGSGGGGTGACPRCPPRSRLVRPPRASWHRGKADSSRRRRSSVPRAALGFSHGTGWGGEGGGVRAGRQGLRRHLLSAFLTDRYLIFLPASPPNEGSQLHFPESKLFQSLDSGKFKVSYPTLILAL